MHTRVLTNSNEFAKYAKCVRVCLFACVCVWQANILGFAAA